MKKLLRILPLLGAICLVHFSLDVRAQYTGTGIGVHPANSNYALHVRAQGTQQPLLLEGLHLGTSETDVMVIDANGALRYRPISDLTLSGEWEFDNAGFIYALRAQGLGNDVVVTNSGRFGIGTTSPNGYFHINLGGDQVPATGQAGLMVLGQVAGEHLALDNNELSTFTGTSPSSLNINPDGGNVLIGQSAPTSSLLDAFGQTRVRILNAGDVDGLGTDDEIVTADATGLLRKVPLTDLNAGEWRVNPTDQFIFAKRADDAGNDVVVSHTGYVGVGTTNPRNSLEVDEGIIIGTGVQGTYSRGEDIRFAGGATSDAIITTQDGTGRWNFKWNATNGASERFLTTGDYAMRMLLNGDPATSGSIFELSHSTVAGTAGSPISWSYPFTVENDGQVGIGTRNPNYQLHTVGSMMLDGSLNVDFTDIPLGTINNVPATDPQILLLDPADQVQRIPVNSLFDFEGEWQDHSSGNYIYARRSFDDNTQNVVVTDQGNLGLGLTNPDEKLEITNGGMRINSFDNAISFRETTNPNDDPTSDGARIYLQNSAFAGWQDALIFEKTDFNNNAIDGGMAFANRQAGNNRTFTMVIRGDGEVGIGPNLTNPTERLHVFGNGLFQSDAIGNSANEGLVKIVDDVVLSGNLRRGVQAAEQYSGGREDFAYFGLEDIGVGNDGFLSWGDRTERDFHISHNNNGTRRDVMSFDGQYLNVGIGRMPTPDANVRLHVGGRVRVDDLNPQTNYDEVNDRIVIADVNGNLRTVTNAVFQQDFEDLDWTVNGNNIYNSNTGNVGVGITNPLTQLHVDGTLRMENSSAIELDDNDVRIFAPNDGQLDIEASSLTTFQNRAATGIDPLVVNHNAGRVEIGIGRAGNQLSATIDGVLRMQDDSEIQFGTDPDNMIYAVSANDLRLGANQLFSIRNRGDGTGILSVRTDQRRVGIGLNNPSVGFDVNDRVRFRNLPAGNAATDSYITADVNGNLRQVPLTSFEGPWDRNGSGGGRTYLQNITDHVGIGTNAPLFPLHIVEATGTPRASNNGSLVLDHENSGGQSSIVFRSRVNRGSDYGYINYFDDNPELTSGSAEQSLLEIGVQNDGSASNGDDIALMPASSVGVKTRTPSRDLDVNGDLRIRTLADNTTDTYALTADANGNVNRQPITSIKDNLGNHIATEDIEVADNTISYDKDPNGGIKFHSSNSVMVSGRFQIGNHREFWMDEAITGITGEGFASNDGAIFAPVYTGTENSDLRLYITDNAQDAFSVWGSPCPTDCGDINASTQVARFEGGGEITFNSLAGTGTRMVVADANGVLNTQAIPTAGGGSTADNLGNHIATQELNLGWNWVRHNSGSNRAFRIRDDGTMQMAANRAIRFDIWNNRLAQTATGMELRAQNDLELQAINNNFIMQAGDRMDLRVNGSAGDDEIRLMTRGANERLVVQNDGEIEIADLTGVGNALVGVDANGVLERVSTSSDGLWDRDAANNETYLRNTGDEVGIGTADPEADLHVARANGSGLANPVELRLQNTSGHGGSAVFFQEGGSTAAGFRIAHDGVADELYVTQGDGTVYATFERGQGQVGIGTNNPLTQFHVVRNITNGGAGAGLINPARLRVQNESVQGSAAIELMEGTGGLGNNNGMSLRYHSTADGSSNSFEIVRGAASNTNAAHVHFRVRRDNGEVTIQDLATGGANEMVVADATGILSTQAFPDAIWDKDDTDSEIFLDAGVSAYRVGIGTNTPVRKLHVAGDVRIDNIGTGAISDDVLTVNASGDIRSRPISDFENFWDRNNTTGALYPATSADNVGIGESNPGAKLHVDGDAIVTTMTAGIVGTDEIVVVDGAGLLKKVPANSFDSFWDRITAGAQDYVQLSNGTDFVGIGTVGAPAVQLHTTGGVRFESLANPSDEVVIADAAGNLSTRALPAELWNRDVANGYTFNAFGSDFVGIGTSTPASRLHVANGQVTITNIVSNTGDLASDRVVVANSSGELRSLPVGELYTPWERNGTDVFLRERDDFVGIGTDDPTSVLHVEDQLPNTGAPMEMRFQNRAGNGVVQMRFRTGTNSGGFTDENNSMTLRYSNQYDALEITNGFVNGDANFASHFKVRRANGFVGINVGTANPSDMLEVGAGNIRISDGNLEIGNQHRIQFEEANSRLMDINNDGDIRLEATDDLQLQANGGAGEIYFRSGGGSNRAILHDNGRFEVLNTPATWDFDVDGASLLSGDVQMESNVRVNTLGGGGTQMVVADNAGNLNVQAIPSFTDSDDQTLSWASGTSVLSIEDGNSVNLSSLLDNTDEQALSYDNTTGLLSISGNTGTIDLGTEATIDDQDLQLSGNILSLTNDATTVDLSGFANTDAQAISVSSDILSITGNASTVDLSPYLDNTDNQDLQLSGNTLSLTGDATPVDLSGYLNTDAQDLTFDPATGILTLTNDGTTVDLSTAAIIDDQTLGLTGNTLSIANGNTVNLANITAGAGWQRSGGVVSLQNATDGVGIGASPITGIRLRVDGIAQFDDLAGSDTRMVVADAFGRLSTQALPELPFTRIGTTVRLESEGDDMVMSTDNFSIISSPVQGQRAVAHFDGVTRRLGLGNEINPLATLHIETPDPLTTPPLMIDNMPAAPSFFSDYSQLIINNVTGVVFEAARRVDHEGNPVALTVAGPASPSVTPFSIENLMSAPSSGVTLKRMLIDETTGDVYSGSATVTSAGRPLNTSDERLKKNIKPIEGVLDVLDGMRAVSFDYIDEATTGTSFGLDNRTHYGVIAQEVQALFPHAVNEVDGYLHVNYEELVGVLLAATKELKEQNEDLQLTNEHLSEQIHHVMLEKADLERSVHSLEAETSELQASMDEVFKYIESQKEVQAGN